jgi:hypothetical protein
MNANEERDLNLLLADLYEKSKQHFQLLSEMRVSLISVTETLKKLVSGFPAQYEAERTLQGIAELDSKVEVAVGLYDDQIARLKRIANE